MRSVGATIAIARESMPDLPAHQICLECKSNPRGVASQWQRPVRGLLRQENGGVQEQEEIVEKALKV